MLGILADHKNEPRVFDLGCGNGDTADLLVRKGYSVVGVDPSPSALELASINYPHIKLEHGDAYNDLATHYGQFPVVISLEVIEHCYYPKKYIQTVYNLLEDGGVAVISTPYHGYLKNLALAVTGRMDAHFTALWDYGHIKFFSIRTLTELCQEAGFKEILIKRIGRIPPLAKTMLVVLRK